MTRISRGRTAYAVSLIAVGSLGVWVLFFVSGAKCLAAEKVTASKMSPNELEAKIAAAGRPRLFFQADGLAKLREEMQTTRRAQWQKLKAAVDACLSEDPPEYRGFQGDPARPGTDNDEMLWQRVIGYRLPALALVALLDPDPRYFEAARKWALKPGEYPLWGAGQFEGTDLAAAHELYGISIAYDWLYDRWSAQDRERLKEILAAHGKVMYEAATGANNRGWWKRNFWQNHSFWNYGALATTSVALAGDVPGVGEWLAESEWAYQGIFAVRSEEGDYHEGVPYWGYAMEALLHVISAVRPYLGEDFYASPFLRSTPVWRLYMAGSRIDTVANFGDATTRDWCVIAPLMYRLAAEYRDPRTQWLAEALPERKDPDSSLYEFLWRDPSLDARKPDDLPLWHAFKTTGFASARTSWADDALTLHVRSGQTSVSHSHLDVNNFLLDAGGEWLVRDYGCGDAGPGYWDGAEYFGRDTVGHNCLLIGGKNQRMDDDSAGVITNAAEENGVVWFRSDATTAYDGAESVVREWALVKPHPGTGKWGYLVVRDRARVKDRQTLDFMLQPGGAVTFPSIGTVSPPSAAIEAGAIDSFVIQGKRARIDARVLSPARVTMRVFPGRGNINVGDPFTLQISAPQPASEVEFIVVLVPLAEGEKPPAIEGLGEGLAGVRVGEETLLFDPTGEGPPHRE